MSGESWLKILQAGKETVDGTAVTATRRLYVSGDLTGDQQVDYIEVDTGTRDRVVDEKPSSVTAGGTLTTEMDAEEIIEFLLAGIKGGVTPTSQSSPTPTVDPTVSVIGTDGTLAAGVYTVAYTVTTPAGESQKKTVTATATITAAHEHIVVGAVTPLAAGATLVTYYVSTAGGGTASVTKTATNATGASINILNPGDGTTVPPLATPTAVQTWVFRPGPTLDSMTLEGYDGYRGWQENGVKVNSIKIAGSPGPGGKNVVTYELFGRGLTYENEPGGSFSGMTGSLTERVPDYFQGRETSLYLDPFGGTPGTTLISNTLVSWDITIANALGRKYFADNTINTGKVTIGALAISGQVTFEANAAALAEYVNRKAGTKRLMRLQFGNNKAVGTGSAKKTLNLDIPLGWGPIDLTPEDQNTKVYRYTLGYVRDPTNGWPLSITAINGRAAAWT